MRVKLAALSVLVAGLLLGAQQTGRAAGFVPISGAGSTAAANAVQFSAAEVKQYGLTVNYQASGATDGWNQFERDTVDFAVVDRPYSSLGVPGSPPSVRAHAALPVVGDALALAYNLKIGSTRVTNLRLSPVTVARIFTGDIRYWDSPAIVRDNPKLALPHLRLGPVVRADGSGSSLHFSAWLKATAPALWSAYCERAGRAADCPATANYPTYAGSNFFIQSGSLGVSGFVAQASSLGTITYVERAYPLSQKLSVARIRNAAGAFVAPSANAAAIALGKADLAADIESPTYPASTLAPVWNTKDSRAYPLANYGYLVAPTQLTGSFTALKGQSLGAFGQYLSCEGQRPASALGHVPLRLPATKVALQRLATVPGADATTLGLADCANPAFTAEGVDLILRDTPKPPACALAVKTQCGARLP